MEHIDNFLNGFIKGPGLSKEALGLLKKWDRESKALTTRPAWRDVFMAQAFAMAQRSMDSNTKQGAIIVNDSNEIIVSGFNSFIRGVEEKLLPNAGPDKYDFMIHSEENAFLNAARQGKSIKDCILYNTGPPCLHCYQLAWQVGIKRIFCGNVQAKVLKTSDYSVKLEVLNHLTNNNMPIIPIDIDDEYMVHLQGVLKDINNG